MQLYPFNARRAAVSCVRPAGGAIDQTDNCAHWGALISLFSPGETIPYSAPLLFRSHTYHLTTFFSPLLIRSRRFSSLWLPSSSPRRSQTSWTGPEPCVSSCVAPVPQAGSAMLLCGGWCKFGIRKSERQRAGTLKGSPLSVWGHAAAGTHPLPDYNDCLLHRPPRTLRLLSLI